MIPKEEIVKRDNQGGLRDFKVVEGGDRRGRGGGGGRMKQRKKKDKYVNEKMCKHNIEEVGGGQNGEGGAHAGSCKIIR